MHTLGASEEDIEAVRQAQQVDAPPEQPQLFEVYHDNWLIVQIFLRCCTQWQYAGQLGVRTGMVYPGVDVIVNRYVPPRQQKAVWDGLQIMERSVLSADARLRNQQS